MVRYTELAAGSVVWKTYGYASLRSWRQEYHWLDKANGLAKSPTWHEAQGEESENILNSLRQ